MNSKICEKKHLSPHMRHFRDSNWKNWEKSTKTVTLVSVYQSKSTLAVNVILNRAKPFVNLGRWTPQPKNVDHPWFTLPFTSSSSAQIWSYQNDKLLNLCCCQARDILLCLIRTKRTPPLNIYLYQWDLVDWRFETSAIFYGYH